jgi:hypothetical protein
VGNNGTKPVRSALWEFLVLAACVAPLIPCESRHASTAQGLKTFREIVKGSQGFVDQFVADCA